MKKKGKGQQAREVALELLARKGCRLRKNCERALLEAKLQVHGLAKPGESLSRWFLRTKKIDRPARSPRPARDPFLSSWEWTTLRYEVLKKHGRRCMCCGRTPADGVAIHVDHIKPRSLYPKLALEESNLQVLCEDCNKGKGAWDETDWRPEPGPVELPVLTRVIPTAEEIEAAKTPHGGWTRQQLAAWGVPWPPPRGWKEELLGGAQ